MNATGRGAGNGYECPRCAGRGWVLPSNERRVSNDVIATPPIGEWPEACPDCGGLGAFTLTRLARLLQIDRHALRRLRECRAGFDLSLHAFGMLVVLFPESVAR